MTDPRPAPYPATTRAKGWRFELDVEQVTQSATWTLAREPGTRGLLLLLWVTSWQQIPCGSLPDDDELLAALVGLEPDEFTRRRRVLMRGWWLADDGRLYHDTIAGRVRDMLGAKDKERQRKSEWRARKEAERSGSPVNVPRDNVGTDGGQTRDSAVSDDTGTGTGTGTGLGIQEDSATAPAHRAGAHEDWESRGTPAGLICKALLSAGVSRVNPSHPTLLALIDAGATVDEFLGHVSKAEDKEDPFAYLLSVVSGERKRAKALAGQIQKGAMTVSGSREERGRAIAASWAAKRAAS